MQFVEWLLGLAFWIAWTAIKLAVAASLAMVNCALRLGGFLLDRGRAAYRHWKDERSRTREWRIRLPYHQLREGLEPAVTQAACFIAARGTPHQQVRLSLVTTAPSMRAWVSAGSVCEAFETLRRMLAEALSDLSRQVEPDQEVRLVLRTRVEPELFSEGIW